MESKDDSSKSIVVSVSVFRSFGFAGLTQETIVNHSPLNRRKLARNEAGIGASPGTCLATL